MPKRADLRSILIVGSGPIRIGQGCEFDYSGAQACRVLRREGYRVVLVNSNPATIMTDPEWADATYLEPLDAETIADVIERERPDAFLPTLGGQTALNLAVELEEAGVLTRYGVELVGAVIPARSTQAQASAGETAELVAAIRREGVRTIFAESALAAGVERAIGEEAGARVGRALWADTLGRPGSGASTWLEAFAADVRALVEGFTDGRRRCDLPV